MLPHILRAHVQQPRSGLLGVGLLSALPFAFSHASTTCRSASVCVNAVCNAFGVALGFSQIMLFVILPKYKAVRSPFQGPDRR
ncbi:MAG: hypothetical protein CYG60_19995 [Actinobacteria bacterium]|nr:MAG: hypothetical protein CYG60_19995 [Actinomycetota bacterium]